MNRRYWNELADDYINDIENGYILIVKYLVQRNLL